MKREFVDFTKVNIFEFAHVLLILIYHPHEFGKQVIEEFPMGWFRG